MVKWWRNHLYSVESVQRKQWWVKTVSHKFIKEKCLFYGLVFQFYSQALFMKKIKKELDMVKYTRSHKIKQYRNELWEHLIFLICNTSKDKPYRLDALHILKAMCEWCMSLVYRYESLLQYKSIFYQPPGKNCNSYHLEKKLLTSHQVAQFEQTPNTEYKQS